MTTSTLARPTSAAELRAHPAMLKSFGKDLADMGDSDLPSLFITNITFNPENVEHLRADLEFVKSLTVFPYFFEGYVEVKCDTPEDLLWECYCHFLHEGLDEPDCVKEIERVRALFIEAGLEAPEEIEE